MTTPREPSPSVCTASTEVPWPSTTAPVVVPSTRRTSPDRRSRMVSSPPSAGHDTTHRSSSLIWHRPDPTSVMSSAERARRHPSAVATYTPRRTTLACTCRSALAMVVGSAPGSPTVAWPVVPPVTNAERTCPPHCVPSRSRATVPSSATLLMYSGEDTDSASRFDLDGCSPGVTAQMSVATVWGPPLPALSLAEVSRASRSSPPWPLPEQAEAASPSPTASASPTTTRAGRREVRPVGRWAERRMDRRRGADIGANARRQPAPQRTPPISQRTHTAL